jgi:hypothetical protein
MVDSTIPSVSASRGELHAALRTLARFVKKRERTADAVLTFAADTLVISAPGGEVTVPATGAWVGEVRVPASFLLGLAARLPVADPLPLRVAAGRLHVGNVSARCVWQPRGEAGIELPLDPPFRMVLAVGLRHSPEEIVRSGLKGLVEKAQERRDALVRRAAEVLAPLGVVPDDLQEMVDEVVLREEAS